MEEAKYNIRSTEVQDMLGYTPVWMIQWGMIVLGLFVVTGLVLAGIIKYPDVIEGSAIITSKNPPIKIVNNKAGVIAILYKRDGEHAEQGDVILEIKSALEKEDLAVLTDFVEKISYDKKQVVSFPNIDQTRLRTFGEIQPEFNRLVNLLNKLRLMQSYHYESARISIIAKQIEFHKNLSSVISNQLKTKRRDVENAINDFNIDKALFEQKVISQTQLFEEEKNQNIQLQEMEILNRDFFQNKITIQQLEKEKLDNEYQFAEKVNVLKADIENSVATIRNFVEEYELNTIIKAPIKGSVDYASPLSENQFIGNNIELLTIVPEKVDLICHAFLPTKRFSKIKMNQKAIITIDNYPEDEYGQLVGSVTGFSLTHTQDSYRVTIKLPQTLETTYHKRLNYMPEMKGRIEIVTEDLTILQRVFNQIRVLIHKDN